MQQPARKLDAELSLERRRKGRRSPSYPVPLVREILFDGHGFATALFDVQAGLVKPV